ncbi:MAG TPA: response regulator [Caldilineaceae bacterium]|nr:response regulator [Caldilineaceae bacterium]
MSIKPIQILLIEDDEIDRTLVQRLLGPTYTVREAATGKAGRALLDAPEKCCDLILLDYRLPDTDSFELLRYAVKGEIPVIVLTGEERPDVIVEAMQEGALDYLLKGQLTKDGLQRAIANGLEKAELRRSIAAQQQQIALQAQALAEQNRQIRALASAVTLAEQRERKRVAQILHDHVQQLLYGVQMRLQLLVSDLADETSEVVVRNLGESTRLLDDAIGAARSLSVDLSPPVLHDEGIDVALQWLAVHMERVHGLVIHLDIENGYNYPVANEDIYVLIFQLVRELLFNVVKHANVKEAHLRLCSEDDRHKIIVEDEGVGFKADEIVQPKWSPEQGYGLYSVRERLALFGGELKVQSHPGNGARVTIVLPAEIHVA